MGYIGMRDVCDAGWRDIPKHFADQVLFEVVALHVLDGFPACF